MCVFSGPYVTFTLFFMENFLNRIREERGEILRQVVRVFSAG